MAAFVPSLVISIYFFLGLIFNWFPISDVPIYMGGVRWTSSNITFGALSNLIMFVAKNLYVVVRNPNELAVLNSHMRSAKVNKYELRILRFGQRILDHCISKQESTTTERQRRKTNVNVRSVYVEAVWTSDSV